ncbi:unnamed protein product [Discosporangium mesarthrocarpum]
MSTMRSTLRLCSNSALAAKFDENRWPATGGDLDEKGRYIMDCDPHCFRKIVDVLRMRKKALAGPGREGVMKNNDEGCVCVFESMKDSFEGLVDMYFPGNMSFVMDHVKMVKP